jgi:hypothetical protein
MTPDQLLEKFGNVKVDGLIYKVQVGAYKDPSTFSDEKLRGICKVKHNGFLEDGSTIIQAEKDFETWKEAEDLLKAVRNAGQADAFLTPYINGKRHYMEDLYKMQIWVKK